MINIILFNIYGAFGVCKSKLYFISYLKLACVAYKLYITQLSLWHSISIKYIKRWGT